VIRTRPVPLETQLIFIMVYRYISPDMKQYALCLIEKGWTSKDIVEALGVSLKSITQWEDNHKQHGHVDPPTVLQDRPRILTSAMTDNLQEMIKETPSLFLDEISKFLTLYHNQPISTTTLHNNLCDLGLTYKHLRRVATECDDVAHAEWLHDILANFTADQMVFLDEESKDEHVPLHRFGCSLSGDAADDCVMLDRGIRYSILPALTVNGYIAVRAIEGSIDRAKFYDFVVNDVVSCALLSSHYIS
jgi:transposase